MSLSLGNNKDCQKIIKLYLLKHDFNKNCQTIFLKCDLWELDFNKGKFNINSNGQMMRSAICMKVIKIFFYSEINFGSHQAELQIRSIKDNSKIIFFTSQQKHML